MRFLDVGSFIEVNISTPVVDVRSPSEFEAGHISDAVNIPLLDDEERAVVGKLYKEAGRLAAIQEGLKIAGPKMSSMATRASELAEDGKLRVYCWRGGMRSQKMAWLFELIGINCDVLTGGYKAYRNHILDFFTQFKHIIVIQGMTGCGKTEILAHLADIGEQILDLEFWANHKGSAFGHIGLPEQPTTPQFHSKLYDAAVSLDPNKRIWIEGESVNIGKVNLPDTLWQIMKKSPVVELCIPKPARIQRLVNEYGDKDIEGLKQATIRISKRLGDNRTQQVLEALDCQQLDKVADWLLHYYDKRYIKSHGKYQQAPIAQVCSQTGDAYQNALSLIDTAKQYQL